MGRELASIHLATAEAEAAVQRDFLAREPAWLAKAASIAAQHVLEEQRQFTAA
jgi:hypothetical protein